MTEAAKRLVDATYAISFDLGNGRSIAVNGNFLAEDVEADRSAKLDSVMRVLERQRARAEVDMLELELKARHKRKAEIEFHIQQTMAQIAAHESEISQANRRRAPADQAKLDQLKSALATHKLNLARMEPEIAEGAAALEEGRRKAA